MISRVYVVTGDLLTDTEIEIADLNYTHVSLNLAGVRESETRVDAFFSITPKKTLAFGLSKEEFDRVRNQVLILNISYDATGVLINDLRENQNLWLRQAWLGARTLKTEKYTNTPQFRDNPGKSIEGELIPAYVDSSKTFKKNIFKLSGVKTVYSYPLSEKSWPMRNFDYLFKREIDPYTGLYSKGHVAGLEEGGIHILWYGFDPSSSSPKLIHKLPDNYDFALINGVKFDLQTAKSYEDGLFLPYEIEENKSYKLSLYDTMENTLPMVYFAPERAVK